MVATMTKSVKGSGTVQANKSATAETSMVSAISSGDTLQVPTAMAPNPPVFVPGMDLQTYIREQQAFLEGLIQQEELQKESVRVTLRAKIATIQAELDPLVLARDEAKRQYDTLSSKCAGLQADINLILEDPVFPQTSKVSRGKGQSHSDGPRDRNGVLFALLPDGTVKVDGKGRKLVDGRALRHVVANNPSLATQYDGNALLAGI